MNTLRKFYFEFFEQEVPKNDYPKPGDVFTVQIHQNLEIHTNLGGTITVLGGGSFAVDGPVMENSVGEMIVQVYTMQGKTGYAELDDIINNTFPDNPNERTKLPKKIT